MKPPIGVTVTAVFYFLLSVGLLVCGVVSLWFAFHPTAGIQGEAEAIANRVLTLFVLAGGAVTIIAFSAAGNAAGLTGFQSPLAELAQFGGVGGGLLVIFGVLASVVAFGLWKLNRAASAAIVVLSGVSVAMLVGPLAWSIAWFMAALIFGSMVDFGLKLILQSLPPAGIHLWVLWYMLRRDTGLVYGMNPSAAGPGSA